MSSITVYAVVEGQTEKIFFDRILTPYLATKNIFSNATIINKPGQKGGDVKFSRAKKDIRSFLRQNNNTYVTTFVDFYGIKEWPGKNVPDNLTSEQKADYINGETKSEIVAICNDLKINSNRFIPYIAMHEFEAMLFSDPQVLANKLAVDINLINAILNNPPPGVTKTGSTFTVFNKFQWSQI